MVSTMDNKVNAIVARIGAGFRRFDAMQNRGVIHAEEVADALQRISTFDPGQPHCCLPRMCYPMPSSAAANILDGYAECGCCC